MPRCWRCRSASPTSTRIALFEDLFLLAVPAGDPRAETARIAADDIDQSRLILLEDGHCLRDQALAFCATARAAAPAAPAARRSAPSSLTTVMQMVAGGYGVTLIPQIAADVERRDERVKFLRLENPQPGRTHRPGVPPHLAAQGGFCGAGRGGEGERRVVAEKACGEQQ